MEIQKYLKYGYCKTTYDRSDFHVIGKNSPHSVNQIL